MSALRVLRRWPLAVWCISMTLSAVPAAAVCTQPPSLVSPANGAVVPGPNVTFVWDDPCAPIPLVAENAALARPPETAVPPPYNLQVSANPSFSPLVLNHHGSSTTYTWISPTAGLYYWRVKNCPIDGSGCTPFSSVRSFTVPLKLLSPAGGENWPPGSIQTVTWQGGGTVKIELFADVTATGSCLTGPSIILAAAATGGSYNVMMPPDIATRRARIQISRTTGSPMCSYSPNPFFVVTPPPGGVWSYDPVDGPNHGWNQSDMCSNGGSGVHAAYFDYLGGANLKLASKLDKTANWVIELVDSTGAVGSWPSIVRGNDGTLHVAYYKHAPIGSAMLYYKSKAPGGNWTLNPEPVASIGVVWGDCSIELLNNVPYIAYNTGNAGGTQLKVLKRNTGGTWAPVGANIPAQSPHHITLRANTFQSTFWLSFIDQGGQRMNLWYWNGFNWFDMVAGGFVQFATPGPYTTAEVALDFGNAPFLAYTIRNTTTEGQKLMFQPQGTQELYFAAAVPIDVTLGTISSLSMEFGPGASNPRIAYVGNGVAKLATGQWNGTDWTWTRSVVDAMGDMDSQVSLVVNPGNDEKWLLYRDVPNKSMRVSRPYWVDTVPPAASPTLNSAGGCDSIYVTWHATGDDGNVGLASSYDLRWSPSPIPNDAAFNAASGVPVALPIPGPSGTMERVAIIMGNCSPHKYFGLKIRDDAGNLSPLTSDPYGAQTACVHPPLMCWEKAGADEEPVPLLTEIAALRPNPTSHSVDVHVALARAEASAALDLSVFDVAGRRVAQLRNLNPGAGRHVVRWDLRDAAGHDVSAGIYFVRMRVAARTLTQRVVVVR